MVGSGLVLQQKPCSTTSLPLTVSRPKAIVAPRAKRLLVVTVGFSPVGLAQEKISTASASCMRASFTSASVAEALSCTAWAAAMAARNVAAASPVASPSRAVAAAMSAARACFFRSTSAEPMGVVRNRRT